MNPFLWDKFTLSEVNDKIRYWVDLWESLIDDLSDPASGVVFINPHLLVRHIIDEIVFNSFQNADNRSYFQRQLDWSLQADPATKDLFATDIALIRREFGGTRYKYLLKLCQTVDSSYTQSDYLGQLYKALRQIFSNSAWQPDDAMAIRNISQCMIVELHLKGYSLETIRRLPANIFDTSTAYVFWHQFPSQVNEADFIRDGQLDVPSLRTAVQTEVDGVTLEQRLNAFEAYFRPESKSVFMLFQVEGLKGDDLNVTLGGVNLYSPKTKRYITSIPGDNSNSIRNEELFGCDQNACFANAAVRVDEFDSFSAERDAIAKIEKALDLFRTFVNSDLPFRVLSQRYIRVSPDGQYWGGGQRGGPTDDRMSKHFRSLDLTSLAKVAFDAAFLQSAGEHLFATPQTDSAGLRIAHSLHWYRKAEETEIAEDRLLGYWIVLENIVSVERSGNNLLLPEKEKETKIAIISEIVPAFETCYFLANSAARLYEYLVNLLSSYTNGRAHLTLPHELATKAMLTASPGSSVDMSIFVSQLTSISAAIDRKTVRDAVDNVHKLYTDMMYAKEEIARKLKATKEELLMIYRLRNRIVHNAHYDNVILPLYVEKARRYAGNAVRQVLRDVFSNREITIEGSLVRYHQSLARIQQRLEKGQAVDFLRWSY